MTVDEAAVLLGINADTVRHQIRLGALVAVKHGRDWHITAGAVERYRQAHLGRPGRPLIKKRKAPPTG
jgi:excisionase family DNA binding protein